MASEPEPEDDRVSVRLQNALQNLSDIVVHADPTMRRPSASTGARWHEKMLELENSISKIRSITSQYGGSEAGARNTYDPGSFGATFPQMPAQFTAPKPIPSTACTDRELEYARRWREMHTPHTTTSAPGPTGDRPMRSAQFQNRSDPGCGWSRVQASRPVTPRGPPGPASAEMPRPNSPTGPRPSTPKGSRPLTPTGPRPSTPKGSRPSTPRGSRPTTPTAPVLQQPEVSPLVSHQSHPLLEPPREFIASQKHLQINGSDSRKNLQSEGRTSSKDSQVEGSVKAAPVEDLHDAASKEKQQEEAQEEQQDEELQILAKMIGEKAALRFKSVRECFRFADIGHSQQVSVHGVIRLCRLFNVDDKVAERFFQLLDAGGNGFVDFREMCLWLGPYIQPGYHSPKLSKSPSRHVEKFNHLLSKTPSLGDILGTKFESSQEEVQRISWLVASKASMKFKSINECFRFIDTDRDGMISRSQLQRFFRNFNLDADIANNYFDLLDKNGSGEIDYNELRACIGQYLAPGYVPPQKPKMEGPLAKRGRPQSARSHRDEQAKLKALIEEREKTKELNKMMATLSTKAFLRFKNARDLFRFADENKDGKISEQELCRFLESFGLPESTAAQYFKFLDKDKSGEVSFAEFMNFFGPIMKPGQQQYHLPSRPATPESLQQSPATPADAPEKLSRKPSLEKISRKPSLEKISQSAKQLQRPSSAASTASGSSKVSYSSKSSKASSLPSSAKSCSSSKSSLHRSNSQKGSQRSGSCGRGSHRSGSSSRRTFEEGQLPQEDLPVERTESRHRLEANNSFRGQSCWFPEKYVETSSPRPLSPASIAPYAENLPVERERRMRSSPSFESSRVSDRLRGSGASPERPWQVMQPVAPKPKAPDTGKPDRTPRLRMVRNASQGEVRSETVDAQGRLIREPGGRGHVMVAMRQDLDARGRPLTPRSRGRLAEQLAEQNEEPQPRIPSRSPHVERLNVRGNAERGVSQPTTLDFDGNAIFDVDKGLVRPYRTAGEAIQGSEPGQPPEEEEGDETLQATTDYQRQCMDRSQSRGPHSITPRGASPGGRGSRSPGRSPMRHFTNQLGQNVFDISGGEVFGSVAEALGRTWA